MGRSGYPEPRIYSVRPNKVFMQSILKSSVDYGPPMDMYHLLASSTATHVVLNYWYAAHYLVCNVLLHDR